MVAFAPNQPITIDKQPTIEVDPGIPPGRWQFRLVVMDSNGQESAPAFLQVLIVPSIGGPIP